MPAQSDDVFLERLLARARAAQSAGGNRKHHLVPATYLRRWEENERVRVTDVTTRRTYVARSEAVGRETDFYSLRAEGIDPDEVPPLTLELLIAEIEASARPTIDALVDGREPDADAAGNLAWFIALQSTRGRAFRESIRVMANQIVRLDLADRSEAWVRRRMSLNGVTPTPEGVRSALDGLAKISSGEWTLAPQEAAMAGLAAEAADNVVPHLLLRHWVVYETPPLLITSDEPFVTLGGPGTPRGEHAGAADAARILFPLSPTRLLVLLRRDLEPESCRDLDTVDVADINRELLANASRWAFERPTRSIASRLRVPPPVPAMINERVAGSPEEGKVVWRQHRPTRWANEPSTPWPVARWWPAQ